jgi:hypothetical protein
MLREGMFTSMVRRISTYHCTEVEGFIDSAVKEALQGSSQADHDKLVDILVQALESDASWVQLYVITGELIVPGVKCPHDHLQDVLKRAIEVRLTLTLYMWYYSLPP